MRSKTPSEKSPPPTLAFVSLGCPKEHWNLAFDREDGACVSFVFLSLDEVLR